MADSNRTLDDILAEARSEPPVLTRDEAELLLAKTPTPGGAPLPRFHWQGYLMTGMIIAAASIVALLVGTPGSDQSNRIGARDVSGASTSLHDTNAQRPPTPPQHSATESPSVNGASLPTPPVAQPATGGRDKTPTTKPTTGDTSISWGYRFAKGQELRYRLVTEVSDPTINDNYRQVREVAVHVDSVDAEGRASVAITRLAETIDRRGTVEVPDVVELQEARQPKVIVATIARDGRSAIERVENDDAHSPMNAGWFVASVFAPLPDAAVTVRRLLKDSSTSTRSIPRVDSSQSISMVDLHSTVHHSYSLIGPRDIGGTPCAILIATTTQRSSTDNASSLTTTINEIYLRQSDGMPIRATSTSTRQQLGGASSTQRTSLELIGEERPADAGAAARDEKID